MNDGSVDPSAATPPAADPVPLGSLGGVGCIRCGYPLRGLLDEGACPECGASVAESAHAAALARSGRGRACYNATWSYGVGILFLAAWTAATVVLMPLGEGLAIFNGCVLVLALFLHIVLLSSTGVLLSDHSGTVHDRIERVTGVIAVAVLACVILVPILGFAMIQSAPNSVAEPCLAVVILVWLGLYASLHWLVMTLVRRRAIELMERRFAAAFLWCRFSFGVTAAVVGSVLICAFLFAMFGWSTGPRGFLESLASVAGFLAAGAHVVTQIAAAIVALRFRVRMRALTPECALASETTTRTGVPAGTR